MDFQFRPWFLRCILWKGSLRGFGLLGPITNVIRSFRRGTVVADRGFLATRRLLPEGNGKRIGRKPLVGGGFTTEFRAWR